MNIKHQRLIEYFQNNKWTEKPDYHTWQTISNRLWMSHNVLLSANGCRKAFKRYKHLLQKPIENNSISKITNNTKIITKETPKNLNSMEKSIWEPKSKWEAQGKNGEIIELYSYNKNKPLLTIEEIKEAVNENLNNSYQVKYPHSSQKQKDSKTQIINISDIHVGMSCDDNMFGEVWNIEELHKRLSITIDHIDIESNKIIINVLGDTTDGYNNQTTRQHHNLPQNLDNKGQLKETIKFFFMLFDRITQIAACPIEVNFLTNENHGGFISYAAANVLNESCNYRYRGQINFNLVETFYTKIKVENIDMVLTHGYDDTHMNKGLPKFLNAQQQTFVERILEHEKCLSKNTLLIRGDQHTFHDIGYQRFRDIMVPTFANPSSWVSMNFGSDYKGGFVIMEINNNQIKTKLIEF